MNKLSWILNRIGTDLKKKWRGILKLLSLWFSLFFVGKAMKFFGVFDYYMPVVLIVVLVGGIYIWYDHEFKWEQKKIVDELKDEKND